MPPRKTRQDDERDETDQVVEREDAQDPADVEAAEVAVAAACVDQDAGDQEPGQHEEEVDAAPAKQREEPQPLADRGDGIEQGEVVNSTSRMAMPRTPSNAGV